MGVKKVYSKPEIEIDRSVFESLHAISDDEWIGWDDTDIDDESTETGTMNESSESTDYISTFDQGEFGW